MTTAEDISKHPRLKRERIMRGWTVSYVATEIGMDIGQYSKTERGILTPTLPNLSRLAELFGWTEVTAMLDPFMAERDRAA